MKNGEWTLQHWHPPVPPDGRHAEADGRVAYLAKQEDFETVILARFGMTVKTIAKFTGLTCSQVQYRLTKLGISTTHYRNGRGPFAAMVFGYCTKRATKQITDDLRTRQDNGL